MDLKNKCRDPSLRTDDSPVSKIIEFRLAVILSEGFGPSRRTPCRLAQPLAPQGIRIEPHWPKCLHELLVASNSKGFFDSAWIRFANPSSAQRL
jgi:hypothetical protein